MIIWQTFIYYYLWYYSIRISLLITCRVYFLFKKKKNLSSVLGRVDPTFGW
jgi:hypothetical protein